MTKRSEDYYIQCPEAMEGTAGKVGIAKHTRASISVTNIVYLGNPYSRPRYSSE